MRFYLVEHSNERDEKVDEMQSQKCSSQPCMIQKPRKHHVLKVEFINVIRVRTLHEEPHLSTRA